MGRLIPRYLWGVNRLFEDGLGQRVSPLMNPFARAKPKVRPANCYVWETPGIPPELGIYGKRSRALSL